MAFQEVPNTVSVELRFALFGQNVENTLYFENEAGVTLGNMATLAGLVSDWWETFMRPLHSSSVVMREIYLTDLSSSVGPTYSDTSSAGHQGGRTSTAAMPGGTTFTVTFRTSERGRSGRGRNYVIGLTEDQVLGNELLQSEADDWVACYEELLGGGFDPYNWVIVSRSTGGAPRAEGLPILVTAVGYADLYIDSQRRRLAGRGS